MQGKKNGKLFSVDIQDCSKVANSKNWNFIKSDDLNSEYILETFDQIKKGDLVNIEIEQATINTVETVKRVMLERKV